MTRALLVKSLEKILSCWPETDPLVKEIRDALAKPEQERKPEQCEWKPEDPDFMPGTYASACGELWSFIDGGPIETASGSAKDAADPLP